MLWPIAVPLVVYGAAYAIAWNVGLAQWSPGGGRWTTDSQIVLNLIVNLAILGVFGTFTALGEELGWRGYLQPRLDAARVRNSVVLVALAWTAFHTPVIVGAGYVDTGSLWRSIGISAALVLLLAFIWAHELYRARSLWPAVFFHSFHNTISQWLFPKFFVGGDKRVLARGGRASSSRWLCRSRRRVLRSDALCGRSWQSLARTALETTNEEPSKTESTLLSVRRGP